MFQVPKSAYALAASSIREFMTPGDELMEVPSPPPAAQEQKTFTEDYYRDGMVVFDIEEVLFRVPKCLFEPGPGKFKPFLCNEKCDEGSDGHAISLSDLTADEFRALIAFFLPYHHLSRGKPSLQHWIDLLSVSTKYELDLIRPVAIKKIEGYLPEVDAVEKYALAEKYMVQEWKASSFKLLCRRPSPLPTEDAQKLGVVIVNKVYTERENIRSKPDARLEHAASPSQQLIRSAGPSRGSITATQQTSSSSKTPQSNVASANSPATTTIKPVFNPPSTSSTSTSRSSTTAQTSPQPTPNQPNDECPTRVGDLSTPAPFSPFISGKATGVSSIQQNGNNSASAIFGFAEPGKPKNPAPSGSTPSPFVFKQ